MGEAVACKHGVHAVMHMCVHAHQHYRDVHNLGGLM